MIQQQNDFQIPHEIQIAPRSNINIPFKLNQWHIQTYQSLVLKTNVSHTNSNAKWVHQLNTWNKRINHWVQRDYDTDAFTTPCWCTWIHLRTLTATSKSALPGDFITLAAINNNSIKCSLYTLAQSLAMSIIQLRRRNCQTETDNIHSVKLEVESDEIGIQKSHGIQRLSSASKPGWPPYW